MPLRAVIFDLDDTLIEEESFARASMRSTARCLPDVAPEQVEEVILSTARSIWRSGPHYRLAHELGIASWEGLWASFEGRHQVLDGLAGWVPTYRARTWEAVASVLGRTSPDCPRRWPPPTKRPSAPGTRSSRAQPTRSAPRRPGTGWGS